MNRFTFLGPPWSRSCSRRCDRLYMAVRSTRPLRLRWRKPVRGICSDRFNSAVPASPDKPVAAGALVRSQAIGPCRRRVPSIRTCKTAWDSTRSISSAVKWVKWAAKSASVNLAALPTIPPISDIKTATTTRSDFNAQNNRLTYDELQQRRQRQEQVKDGAKKAGAAIAGLNFKEGIQSVATAEGIGDYFRYTLDQKISLPRQKSAMLPILDQTIEGTKVSIFNETIHAKYPLLGLKLKNTSGEPLTQGPITVYDNSTYAGDTRILDLQPNEERLLSYALDQGTEVKSRVQVDPKS